jgi:hypothetical protein
MQRFGREDKKLEAEVEQRTKDVRHEKGDIPTGAGAEAESCREQEKFRNLPLMHNRPHREPQYPGRKECLKRNDDPGLKCAVEDVHDDAVDLRTGLKQSRVTEPEQLAEDGTTVPKVLAQRSMKAADTIASALWRWRFKDMRIVSRSIDIGGLSVPEDFLKGGYKKSIERVAYIAKGIRFW